MKAFCISNKKIFKQETIIHFDESRWNEVAEKIQDFCNNHSSIFLNSARRGADKEYIFSMESGWRIWLCADHAPYKPGPRIGAVTSSVDGFARDELISTLQAFAVEKA